MGIMSSNRCAYGIYPCTVCTNFLPEKKRCITFWPLLVLKMQQTCGLPKKKIPFSEICLKSELVAIVKNANKIKTFSSDKIIYKHSYLCLRLPP